MKYSEDRIRKRGERTLKLKERFRKKSAKAAVLILAVLLLAGGGIGLYEYEMRRGVPELVTFVDTEGSISISEEEVPLGAAPKVTKKTTTKTKKKKVRMKKASKRTYSKKLKTRKTTKTTRSKKETSTVTKKTQTTVSTTERYKKKSKIKTVITTTKTTVTTTTVAASSVSTTSYYAGNGSGSTGAGANAEASISQIAPKVDSRVSSAFHTLGFKIYVNSGVSYSGVCDTKNQSITLKRADDTVYHELGHFVAFVAGNADRSSAFQSIYSQEKGKYTAYNKTYVTQNSSEYFAESFKEYTLNPSALQKSRPQTYGAIQSALSKVTSDQVNKILRVYGSIWK